MKLSVEWGRPLVVRKGGHRKLDYRVDLDRIPGTAGIYVLGRKWGKDFEALYVGRASNIRRRIKGQLNNLRLMQHLDQAKTGKRVIVIGEAVMRGRQRTEKVLGILERAFIRHFLSEGHDLVNKQGVRIRRHEVTSTGYQPKKFIPSLMYLEKARGE